MNLFKRLKAKYFSPGLNALRFDDIDNESRFLVNTNDIFIGSKIDVYKNISPNIQLAANIAKGTDYTIEQLNLTCVSDKTVIQTIIDRELSWQSRITDSRMGILSSLQTLFSKKSGIFSQIEINKSFANLNFGFKVVSPAIKNVNPIYIFNNLTRVGPISLGLEAVANKSDTLEIGVNAGLRIDNKKNVFAFQLQQCTAMSLSYFHRYNEYMSSSIATTYSLLTSELQISIGNSFKTKDATVKNILRTDGIFYSHITKQLSPSFTLEMSNELNLTNSKNRFGVGFSLFL